MSNDDVGTFLLCIEWVLNVDLPLSTCNNIVYDS